MYELRIKLPFLQKDFPGLEEIKHHVAKTGSIPSHAMSSDPDQPIDIVWIEPEQPGDVTILDGLMRPELLHRDRPDNQ